MKKIIGWKEHITLPDLGIVSLPAKMDTGARVCSLHATNIKIIKRHHKKWVSFDFFHPITHKYLTNLKAPLVEHRHIRSSNNQAEERPIIVTTIQMGSDTWPIEVSLTDRQMMGFKMLIGRKALRRRFMIDPSHRFLIERKEE